MFRYLPLVLFIAAYATTCLGEEVILPLDLGVPELYLRPGDDIRLDFDAASELTGITGAVLHVTGTYWNARSYCWQFGNPGGGVWSYDEEAGLSQGFVAEQELICVTEHVFAAAENEEASFDFELIFDCGSPGADWSIFAAGTGTVYLTGLDCDHFPSYPEVCICDHSAMVESATLVIQLEDQVAVEQLSWGLIKARYR